MSVEIDPVELGFHRPFTTEVSQILKLTNPNVTPVAFKVKTTAPKQYCVRPNSGRIEPGRDVEVTVLLQAMKEEPPLDAKCRDKFLVQSVALTANKEFTSIAAIWSHVDNAEKSSVQEKKIRVVFLPAVGSAGLATPVKNGINGHSGANDTPSTAPPAYRSPSPEEAFTPQTQNRNTSTSSEEKVSKETVEPVASTIPAAVASIPAAASSAAASVSNAVPTSVEDLKAQLAEARATIASYGQEGNLRMRKAVNATKDETTTQAVTRQATSEGVPIQIVAALCLLSFLLAYLFF